MPVKEVDICVFCVHTRVNFHQVSSELASFSCSVLGVAIVFCYINQTTFFAACLSLNEKRIAAQRHFFCLCTTVRSKNEYRLEEKSALTVFCCAGQKPTKRRNLDSYLERFPGWLLPKITLHIVGKVVILIGFLVYLGVAIWGAVNLEQGLVIKNLVSKDSYFYKYTTWREDNFISRVPVSFVIDNTVQYHSSDIQNKVHDLIARVEDNQYMSSTYFSWLETYLNSPYTVSTSEADFIQGWYNFIADARFARFKNDVKVSADNTSILASRVYVFTSNIKDSQDSGKMMLEVRDVASNSPGLSVTAFAPAFIFYEQYVAILPQTLQTLGASLACVFVITAIFMPHPLLLLYIVVTMAMIIVGIIGFMHHWGLTLSSITMIHIIMSVGFSVDYTAHTCHAFMVATGKDRNERVKKALQASGSPIFNGALSSVIGIAMLAAAKSYIFNSFFRVMLLVILFGIGHSVLFLPVILSVIGPGKSKEVDEKEEELDGGYQLQPQTKKRISPEPPYSAGPVARSTASEITVYDQMSEIVGNNPKSMAVYDGSKITVMKSPK